MDEKTFEKEYLLAVEKGKIADQTEPRAKSIYYDQEKNQLIIVLRSGIMMIVPCQFIQGLANAPSDEIRKFKILAKGADVHWDSLDVQVTVKGLMLGIFGTKKWMTSLVKRNKTSMFQKEFLTFYLGTRLQENQNIREIT